MNLEILAELFDDEDMLELVQIELHQNVRAAKNYRHRDNHFEKWNDTEFLQRFRFSKNGVRFVLRHIADEISNPTERNHAVSAEIMLFVTLRYYATGSFLQVCGDFAGIDKATACRIVHKVSRAIASLYGTFIRMPETEEEMRTNSLQFFNIARFPKCIGALDCTHVKIISPGGDQAEIYRNRKQYFSYNVQAVCDSNGKFEDIVCRWPGSSHDSTIFNNSTLRAKFENRDYSDYVLVGDSGYGIRPFLITPLTNPTTVAEHHFNESQIRTRNPIERCFGVWKRRFPILSFGIRCKKERVEAIVIAAAVLHNIACLLKEEIPQVENEEEAVQAMNNMEAERVPDNVGGINNVTRYQLIQYFNSLL